MVRDCKPGTNAPTTREAAPEAAARGLRPGPGGASVAQGRDTGVQEVPTGGPIHGAGEASHVPEPVACTHDRLVGVMPVFWPCQVPSRVVPAPRYPT